MLLDEEAAICERTGSDLFVGELYGSWKQPKDVGVLAQFCESQDTRPAMRRRGRRLRGRAIMSCSCTSTGKDFFGTFLEK